MNSIIFVLTLTACAGYTSALLPMKGSCPKVTYSQDMKDWRQGEGTWNKVAQSSNPLFNDKNVITCSSEIRLENIFTPENPYAKFMIYDRYTRGSSSDPEYTRLGKVYLHRENEPASWTFSMNDQSAFSHRIIEFKENEYMLAFVCTESFDSSTHGTAQWYHDEKAVLYVKEYPAKLTQEKKTQLMSMVNESLKKNAITSIQMSFVGGLVNGEDC